MEDQDKTKTYLIDELNELPRKVTNSGTIEKSLAEEASIYRRIVDETNEAIFIIQDGMIKFFNKATLELTGYSAEEDLVCQAIETFVYLDDRDLVNQYHTRRLQGDKAHFRYEYRFVCQDGTVKWGEMNSSLIMWQGKPAGLCLVTDITERKLAEKALRESEQKFRRITENSTDALWQLTPDLVFTDIVHSRKKLLGYEPDELLGKPIWEVLAPDKVERLRQKIAGSIKLLLSDREGFVPEPYEIENVRPDGTTVWTESIVSPVFNNEGNLIAFEGISRDITERKRLEKEKENLIIELQKTLSEVKQLSGFLPICSSCKKIRDDEGYWKEVETYISDHSETQFSHGICPDCIRKLYPEYADEVLLGLEKDEKK